MPVRTPAKPTRRAGVRKSPKKAVPKKAALAAPYVAVVLDETGSMREVKAVTISSYNEYLATLQKDPNAKGARFSLTRFNTNRTVIGEPIDVATAQPLTAATYQPDALTDLYDAIGKTITSIDRALPKGPVIVMILTDGDENSSKEYKRTDILRLIEERQATGRWTFVYLGSNQDAWTAGGAIGIPMGNTMSYDPSAHGTHAAIDTLAGTTGGLLRTYARSGGLVTASASAIMDAGIDRCLACHGTLVMGQPHVCAAR